MDINLVKARYGDQLALIGNIDMNLLSLGTPDQVREQVRQRIKDLAPGGGYVCAAVHSILADVPVENICAMFDEAIKAGKYPLSL
jgi:uroporphyrinogen decarboxylase